MWGRDEKTTSTCLFAVMMMLILTSTNGFFVPKASSSIRIRAKTAVIAPYDDMYGCSSTRLSMSGYTSPVDDERNNVGTTSKKSLHPKVGDMVAFYDLDGGREDGELLVGRISFISKQMGTTNDWLVDLTQMEDVGDGYYADFSSAQKRSSKKFVRNLQTVRPIMGSFVRSEAAYKVPIDRVTGQIKVRADSYDLDDYKGPIISVNPQILEADNAKYASIKGQLLKSSFLTGLAGTILADLIRGPQDAIIYGAGALASLGYLFFLAIKTDTIGSQDAKLGKSVSNLRFAFPVLVLVGVALYNQSLGDANPSSSSSNPFSNVTTEQFASAILGFLTYRFPLFLTQLLEGFKGDNDDDLLLPGSVGVASQLLKGKDDEQNSSVLSSTSSLTTVLLVSGPQAAGRTELVDQFMTMADDDSRFVLPQWVDRSQDGATFERLESRGEFLETMNERFGLTKDSILKAVTNNDSSEEKVVVVNANVDLAKKLTQLSGIRLVGVWVGLDSVADFESRVTAQINNGSILIPPEETKESILRAKIREIVQEIEFGISSGIFEFTILNNQSPEESLRQLREAANYCFR